MADTIDYSKVFASGATSQREWDDADYIKGWETNGSVPPSVEKFDALQRNTDRKLKDLNERVEAAGEGGMTEVNDNTMPTADRDTIGNIIDALAHQIKAVSGKDDWKDAPSIDLNNVNLKALANLTGQTDAVPLYSSANALATLVLSTIGKSMMTAADAPAARSTIGAAGTATATQSANGLMTATDKAKLDGIADQANKYSLPAATSSTLGGVKIGSGINVASGTISLPAATNSALGGVKVGSNISVSDGTISVSGANVKAALGTGSGTAKYLREDGSWVQPPNTTYSTATTSANGLMSSTDKSKLDGIANNANNYSLPTAAASTLGGVKIGSNINISSGVISVSNMTAATASAAGKAGLVPAPAAGNQAKFLRGDGTWQIPTDTNTHYTSHLYAGSGSAANASTTNGNTKITVADDSTVRNSVTIKGTGATTVTSDANGVVTVNNTNTTYSTGIASSSGITKLYTGVGDNTDGTMTQKAIKAIVGTGGGIIAASLSANGYVKFANGFILQWGTGTCSSDGISFPIAFPNGCYAVLVTRKGATDGDVLQPNVVSFTNSKVFIKTGSAGSPNLYNSSNVNIVAIGK